MNVRDIPLILYHATYTHYLKSIKRFGLGSEVRRRSWESSRPGVVCLASDKDEAYSYAEIADTVPDTWHDRIVVLAVNTADLNKSKIFPDTNIKLDPGQKPTCFEYRGTISFEKLSVVKI